MGLVCHANSGVPGRQSLRFACGTVLPRTSVPRFRYAGGSDLPSDRHPYVADPLFRGVVGVTAFHAALYVFLILNLGQQSVSTPSGFSLIIMTLMPTGMMLAGIGAFLALGRYRVLGDPMSYWIGVGFTSYSVAMVFRTLT